MATVDGLTKDRMLAIEAESITAARIDPVTNHLILTTHGGTDIDVGNVQGPQGLQGPIGPVAPSGAIMDFAGSAIPSGWLVCDGSAVLRATYASLFAAIGTTWGVGDGSTTFNLPDIRGRVSLGSGLGSGLTNRVLGSKGGEESHLLITSEMPAHGHPTANDSHGHGITYGGAGNAGFVEQPDTNSTQGLMVGPSGVKAQGNPLSIQANASGVTVQNNGGGGAHNNMPPWVVTLKIIKT